MLQKIKNWWDSFWESEEKEDIPSNLTEAIQWLMKRVPEEEQEDIAKGELEAAEGHFYIGMWMRNNWGLWTQDSRLYRYFVNIGIRHPDDMTGIILKGFQAQLRGESFSLKEQVEHYRNYWKEKDIDPDELCRKQS